MSAFDYNTSTLGAKGAPRGLGPLSPEASLTLLHHQHHRELSFPKGLVVSGDNSMRADLGEVFLDCGIAPVFAINLEQAAPHAAQNDLCFIVCHDKLPDGKYEDLLLLQHGTGNIFPMIVVSSTGDWPEFFEAVDLGAYDFLAYPLIPGELQRIIRNLVDETRLRRSAPSYFCGDPFSVVPGTTGGCFEP
jgi:DNA-binding response OmpR family regulator